MIKVVMNQIYTLNLMEFLKQKRRHKPNLQKRQTEGSISKAPKAY